LSKEHRQAVSQLSALLRLAVALDRRQIGAIAQIKCDYYHHFQQFNLLIYPSRPDDNCALELWSLDYKKAVFEAEFGVKLLTHLEKNLLPNFS